MLPILTGRPGDLLFERDVPGLGIITVSSLDPTADLDVIHSWVNRPSAQYWGLGDLSRDELRLVYEHVDSLETHHAYLVRRDSLPVVLLQAYQPEHDPVGEAYAPEPGDVGMHFFLGDRGPFTPAFTTRIGAVIFEFLFTPPNAQRIVVEPDIGNQRAIARMSRFGFTPGPKIDLPGKRARLAFLTRTTWLGATRTAPPEETTP